MSGKVTVFDIPTLDDSPTSRAPSPDPSGAYKHETAHAHGGIHKCTRDTIGTYLAWWARAACRRASRSGPVAAVASACSRTGRPSAVSRRTPSDWCRRTATCRHRHRRRTLRPHSGPRTVCARLSDTICRARATGEIVNEISKQKSNDIFPPSLSFSRFPRRRPPTP